ncbi:MAG: TerL protein [Gammaproteobacteria bacterium]|nr:TerL protein [Gammaproteobacteria bacterium]MDP2346818.1 TerL protein [Gammaproteobacteria bacterium]
MDYSNPNYSAIFAERARRLQLMRLDPRYIVAAKKHYKDHPWDMVRDWGMTYDPREVEKGHISNMPFIPWKRQVEYMQWVYQQWKAGERGLVEKSRDCGVTWLSVGLAVALWCTNDGVSIGFGSRKKELVDKLGNPDSIFEKVRHFVMNLPRELWPEGFDPQKHSSECRLISPVTGSSITGEGGDDIGRGGRKSIYFIDEAASIEHQESVDAALSQTTNCQIDISTFKGSGNLFYRKQQRFFGTKRHFIFDWRDDPRKDDAWYQQQKDEQPEEIVAQEIDRDPNASNTDSFIPARWVVAAIDAHVVLGIEISGIRTTGFDPADTGDARAISNRYGIVTTECDELKAGDINNALPWAYEHADNHRADLFIYDADGMGAPVIKVDIGRHSAKRFQMVAYYGSGEVRDKDQLVDPTDPKSKKIGDRYSNFKAQSWDWVRERFRLTYLAVTRAKAGMPVIVDPDKLISISSKCTKLRELQSELSRPRRILNEAGKIAVESKKQMRKRGVASPNLAESFIMAYSNSHLPDPNDVRSFEPDFEL